VCDRRWVAELSSGNSVVLELTGDDAVPTLREFAGPFLPDVARHVAPTSLRARFGVDGVRNAVHVTDLPRDGPLESKFLFHVV
jgi:nucleoside-diphosphate kinase